MKLNIDDAQRFGIEIEYLNVDSDVVERSVIKNLKIYNWHYERDYSLEHIEGSYYAGELISPILTNKDNDLEQIEEACKLLVNLGAYTDEQCAAHVHFDSSILEKNGEYYQNFLLLYLYFENVIYEFATGYDSKLRDCAADFAARLLPEMTKSKLSKLIKPNFDYNDFMQCYVYGSSRNQGVNFRNLLQGEINTIEFRMANGTLNPEIWFNNITVYGRLLQLAKEITPIERLELYKKIIIQRKDLLNYYTYNEEKENEFISFISKDEEDKKHFIKQYKKGL